MQIIPPGIYRVDILILFSYQMCHFFSIQQLFPIFLNYTPKTTCVDTPQGKVCYDVPKNKCMQNQGYANICRNLTGTALADCHTEKSFTYYQSAAMEYNIYCKPGWKDFRPAFVQYVGVLIGNIILGYVADQIGRRKTFIISMLIGIPALSLSATFNNIAAFYFFRALTGIGIAESRHRDKSKSSTSSKDSKRAKLEEMIKQLNSSIQRVEESVNQLRDELKRKDTTPHLEAPPAKKGGSNAVCIFCGGNHAATECTLYSTRDARWAEIGRRQLCWHCGATPPHNVNACNKRNRRCKHCHRPHLTALCQPSAGRQLTEESINQCIQVPAQHLANTDTTKKP